MELWKDIKDYEGLYQISNLGKVKRLAKTVIRSYHGSFKIEDKILKPNYVSGYLKIGLTKNKKRIHYLIHRLVCLNFLGKHLEKIEVNHKNGIKSDNKLENLEWCSPSENSKHAYKIGLRSQKGQKNNLSKLTDKQVYEIKYIKRNMSQIKLAHEYNVSKSSINYIINNKTWKHI
jgi:hypothetical protein